MLYDIFFINFSSTFYRTACGVKLALQRMKEPTSAQELMLTATSTTTGVLLQTALTLAHSSMKVLPPSPRLRPGSSEALSSRACRELPSTFHYTATEICSFTLGATTVSVAIISARSIEKDFSFRSLLQIIFNYYFYLMLQVRYLQML